MTPSARLAAAAEIVDSLDLNHLIDPQLKVWARHHRFAGSADRRAIADRVYACVRRWLSSAALGGSETGRGRVLGTLIAEDGLDLPELCALFAGGYGLAPLSSAEISHIEAGVSFASQAQAFDWPGWLLEEAKDAFGNAVEIELQAFQNRAPLYLRINTLRASPSAAIAALAAEGHDSEAFGPLATTLRLPAGTRISTGEAFLSGLVELQDASSQRVADFCQVLPGQTVLDFCAGAGGKALALAADMENVGRLMVHDINPRRMADIPARAARCGIDIIKNILPGDILSNSCDMVLVDAPCSGSGSWRRDPLGKWRLSKDRLSEIMAAQHDALTQAQRFVRPGGTLIYATCSILPSENKKQIEWFEGQFQAFRLEDHLSLWLARDGGDGFFAARFRKSE